METTQMSKVNVQTQNIQMTQTTVSKDTISEVGSFQNTLKDLNVSENKQTTSNDVKTEVTPSTNNKFAVNNSNVQNETVQKDNDVQTQTYIQSQQANAENILIEEQNILQNKNLSFIYMNNPEILNSLDQMEQQDAVNINQLPLLEDNQVNQTTKELVILPQIINETKEAKDLKEPKGMIKIGHISKDTELDKMDNNLKFLDESLKAVSDKNLNQTNNVNETTITENTDLKSLMIANIDTKLSDNNIAQQSLLELNSKISAINSINNVTAKTKTPLGAIKMTKEDANFFVNMVENQNNNVFQANITVNNVTNQVNFTDVKAQAAQSSAAVSQALIEKLQDSMNTNKAFRVDFDNNVAVIMRVDSNGVLSANFIPGSSAVEQYLRNNIAELRQAFENKGLEYNELSYTSKKQNQNRQQQRNHRGGQDE